MGFDIFDIVILDVVVSLGGFVLGNLRRKFVLTCLSCMLERTGENFGESWWQVCVVWGGRLCSCFVRP